MIRTEAPAIGGPQLGFSPVDTDATTRRPEPVLPSDLHPGDQLRDHGMFRTVKRVEKSAKIADSLVVVFEPGERSDTLTVKAQQPVIAWREAAA